MLITSLLEAATEATSDELQESPPPVLSPLKAEPLVRRNADGAIDYGVVTPSNDAAHGGILPDLSALQFCSGAAPEAGKPTVVFFWAKYLKDNCYEAMAGLNGIFDDPANELQVERERERKECAHRSLILRLSLTPALSRCSHPSHADRGGLGRHQEG